MRLFLVLIEHRGLCDCDKKSVELFCKRVGWPQQLIDDILDLFHKVLEKEAAFAAEMNQLCLALSKLTIVSLELPSPPVVVSDDGGGGGSDGTRLLLIANLMSLLILSLPNPSHFPSAALPDSLVRLDFC